MHLLECINVEREVMPEPSSGFAAIRVRLDELMVEAVAVRQLSHAVIGCAADIAINAFNAGDLNLLFLRAGLKPESGYGKSALVSNGITAAVRTADRGDRR